MTGRYPPGSTRRRNAALLLGHLHRNGPCSRSDVVTETGLTKAAVANLVHDLIEWGLVQEREVTPTGQTGRPARPLAVAGHGVEGIGLDLGSDRVIGLATDLSGSAVAELGASFVSEPDAPLAGLVAAASSVLDRLLDGAAQRGATVGGVCVSVPARLDRDPTPASGESAGVVSGLLDALTRLAARRGGPQLTVVVERSAGLAAVAEQRLGGTRAAANLVTIDGGVAVEGGVVIDGDIARGASGLVGDLGHLVVDPGGNRCGCGGRGCWETVVGVEAILRECAPDLARNPRAVRSPAELGAVAERAAAGDTIALEGLSSVGHWLGVGLASVVALLNPEVVVLDGSFRRLAPWILEPAVAALRSHAPGRAGGDCFVAVSDLAGSASSKGAALVAVELVLADPVAAVEAGPPMS